MAPIPASLLPLMMASTRRSEKDLVRWEGGDEGGDGLV